MPNLRPVALSCLCAAVLAAACNRPATRQESSAQPVVEEPVIAVRAVPVRRGEITEHISAPGTLAARRTSQIGAEVRGRILDMQIAEGDRVEAGDPLFSLDPRTYQMVLRQAQAGLDVAAAERKQLEAELVRASTLGRKDVLAKQEVERLTTKLEVAKAYQRQATETVAVAQLNLDETVVRAPFAGSVAARLADEGTTALVQPQTIVVILQETAQLEARAAIPESQMARVHVGDRARITVEGAPPIDAQVDAVTDTIDEATRTYLVKIGVNNADHRLKAGVFAHVEIMPAAKQNVLLIPRDAIRTEEGHTRILVVRAGRAEPAVVEVGMVSEDEAEILAGVVEEDLVISGDDARTIAPGLRVRVVDEAADETG